MLEKMQRMLSEQLNCDADSITPETSFKDDLGADSLDLFELVMALEEALGGVEVEIDDDAETVGELVESIERQI